VDVILEALAHFKPARAVAHSGASSALASPGRRGARPIHHAVRDRGALPTVGGLGPTVATATREHLSNSAHHANEILESEYPCRITRFDLVPNSGARVNGAAASPCSANTSCWKTPRSVRRFNKTRFPARRRRPRQGRQPRPLRGPPGTPQEIRDARLREGSRCTQAALPAAERRRRRYGDPARRDPAALAVICEGMSREVATKHYGKP